MSNDSEFKSHGNRSVVGLVCILLLAAFLRWFFHPSGYGSMDHTAAGPAVAVTRGEFEPSGFASYRRGLIYPIAGFFEVLGVGLYSLTAYSFVCSIGSIIVAYAIARHIAGDRAGLYAAGILTVLPLAIELSGQAVPDGPQAFFGSLGLWLLLLAEGRPERKAAFGFFSGIALGISYLCKITTLLLGPVFLLYAVIRREARVPFCYCVLGGAIVMGAEAWVNKASTGDALARLHSVTGASNNLESHVRGYSTQSFVQLPKRMFLTPESYGLHMYFAIGAFVYCLFRRMPQCTLPLMWSVWFICYIWLGTRSFSSYERLSQSPRYLALANVSLAVLTGIWLSGMQSKRLRVTSLLVLSAVGLFFSNIKTTDNESTLALNVAWKQVLRDTDKPVHVNGRSDHTLRFLSGLDTSRNLIRYGRYEDEDEPVQDLSQVRDAFIVADYVRIRSALKRRPEERYPDEIFDPPDHWEERLVVNNPGRKTSYWSLQALRFLANLPIAPKKLGDKVTSTIDDTLMGRDLAVFYAPPADQTAAPKDASQAEHP